MENRLPAEGMGQAAHQRHLTQTRSIHSSPSHSLNSILSDSVQAYEVNPLTHDFGAVNDVLAWTELIPASHLTHILDAFFFPKWFRILHHWLTHGPDLEEVSNWYISWKSIFPAELLKDVKISSQFGKAIDLMNRAAERATIPALEVFLGARPSAQRQRTPVVSAMPKMIFTLRDMVQKFAEDNNVTFVPKPGRMHEGLQVYSFGGVSVVLDNAQNSVRAQQNHLWKPISLEQLFIEMHNRR